MLSLPAQPPLAPVLKPYLAEVCALAHPSVLAGLRAGQALRCRRVATARGRTWRNEVRTSGGELFGYVPPADAAWLPADARVTAIVPGRPGGAPRVLIGVDAAVAAGFPPAAPVAGR